MTTDDIPVLTGAEAAAVALVDRRGRAAVAALATAVEARVDDQPDFLTWSEGPDDTAEITDDQNSLVVDLTSDRPPSGRRSRPWWLAAAAAAVLVAAGLGSVVASRPDGHSSTASGGRDGAYLVPGWVPDGLRLLGVTDPDAVGLDGASAGEVVVYGDAAAEDPWAGRTISALYVDTPPDALPQDGRQDRDTVTVAGQTATIADRDGFVIERGVDGGTLAVSGSDDVTRDEALGAAEGADTGPAIDPDALPAGFAEIARGPLSASIGWFSSTYGSGLTDGAWAVQYEGGTNDEGDPLVLVVQRPGTRDAVDLARVQDQIASPTEVRGHDAVSWTDADHREVALQWLEPPGNLVTVVGRGITEANLRRIAEGLRPARDGEIPRMVDEVEVATTTEDADSTRMPALEEGQFEVATGESDGEPWRLVATDRPGEIGLETWYRDGSAGTGWDDVASIQPLEVVSSQVATWDSSIVFGLVEDGAAIAVEPAGHEPVVVQLFDVEGWSSSAFVAFVPAGVDGDVTVVAHRPDGTELARDVVPGDG